eukprot:2863549-Pyramimonas_sp.AAC.1
MELASLGVCEAGSRRGMQMGAGRVQVREYDVPYHVRFCIDTEVRCGLWFKAKARGGNIELERCKDLLAFAEVKLSQGIYTNIFTGQCILTGGRGEASAIRRLHCQEGKVTARREKSLPGGE